MDKRIMVRISASGETVSLRTVSREFRSPHRFVLLEDELRDLEEKRHVLASDIRSFADMRLCKAVSGGDDLEVTFSWLQDCGHDGLLGRAERVRLPYRGFLDCIRESRGKDGEACGMLSACCRSRPRIEFRSRNNLKAVVANRMVRGKLGRFIDRNLNWVDYERILVTDDWLPYSFAFAGYTPYGRGICGGIILHGQDDLRRAYYGMHT